jgi:hypothetical protein
MPGTPPNNPPTSAGLTILEGEAHLLFAFDIGLAIELDEAERMLTAAGGVEGRESIGTAQRTPEYFEFRPAPLRVARDVPGLTVGGREIDPRVECVLYDFGAVSLSYRLPISGPLEGLVALADELYENPALIAHARQVAESIAVVISRAVRRPGFSPLVEDYVVYHARHVEAPGGLAACLADARPTIARVLRAERGPLSEQEAAEALASSMSYSPMDAVIVDWNAALVVQEPAQDILTVLEFANVELLEVRYLDDRLDGMLDRTYDHALLGEGEGRRASRKADMRRIAGLQMDAALLFESVNNALKLLGDQYLARVYRLAAHRFHLADWDQSIQRKVSTLEGIYRKMADDQATRRMEVLEWIIILLFVVSIVLPFVTNAAH